jgi:hypothetical protein
MIFGCIVLHVVVTIVVVVISVPVSYPMQSRLPLVTASKPLNFTGAFFRFSVSILYVVDNNGSNRF